MYSSMEQSYLSEAIAALPLFSFSLIQRQDFNMLFRQDLVIAKAVLSRSPARSAFVSGI